uniref:Coat protein n=1 Tax=Metarhizium brunneum bipartite mycovirus 1 TaxID=2938193 RepID=A0A976N0K0_9VIRU|nr:coat protein [Metarhizium brunneum bipartite mycovirus 1]
MATFAERFGGAKSNVDFTAGPSPAGQPLETPSVDDTLEAIEAKMAALARVVIEGRSVAVATGYTMASQATRDPEELAKSSMTPMELEQLAAWKEGVQLPPINWDECTEQPKGGEKALKRMEYRAAALRQLYGNKGVTAGNALWFTKNHEYILPLVVATAKIQGAVRELAGGQTELSELEMAEVQSIHKVNAVALQVVNDLFRQLNATVRKINASKDTLQAREHALKGKIAKWKPKQSVLNKQRAAVGKPPIGRQVDFRGATEGGRVVRSSLLAGTGLAASSAPTRQPRARAQAGPSTSAQEVEMEGMY